MKVILLEDIKGVGKKDQIINASDGYFRNFLLPKNKAVEANKENMAKLKARENAKQYKKDQDKEYATQLAEKLSKIMIKVKVKVGDNGKIFGGVSSKDISEILKKEYDIEVDKKKIELKEAIKVLGITTVKIRLYEGIYGKVKVDVISE